MKKSASYLLSGKAIIRCQYQHLFDYSYEIFRHLRIVSLFLGLILCSATHAASLIEINDNDLGSGQNQYQYTGNWQYGSQAGAYHIDNHWSSSVNASYQINFTGTQIDLYAAKTSTNGIAGVSIDGGTEVLVDCYSANRVDDTLIYSSPSLNFGSHQIKVRVTGTKNQSSQGTTITADRAVVHTSNAIMTNVNDNTTGSGYNQFNYVGNWQYGQQDGAYNGDNHWSNDVNGSYSVQFNGSQVLLFGALASNHGIATVSVDNGTPVSIDCYSAVRKDQSLLYTSPLLTPGSHTLTVKVSGQKNSQSQGTYVVADRVSILSYPQSVVPEPDVSYVNLSTGLFRYRPITLFDRSWNVEIYDYHFSQYPSAAIKASIAKYKLADTIGDTYFNNLYEWDYTFHFGSGGGYVHQPTSVVDAYQMVQNWYSSQLDQVDNAHPSWITAITGHYYYPHYSALWGDGKVDMIMSEIGENVKGTNPHLAFVRGAARQFDKPWGLQFSPWYGGYVLDYSSPPVWQMGGPNYGHSLQLAKRSYFLTYMSGANELHAESGSADWFNGSTLNADGTFNLSPMGLIAQNFYAFSHSFTDRGIPWTPMAIVLDQYQGLSGLNLSQTFYGMLASNHSQTAGFTYSAGMQMDVQLFNTLWPQSFSSAPFDESTYYLVNSPYGDMYDVLLDNVSLDVLRQYPIVYMGGSVNMNSILATQLEQYVERGGTLILNSAVASSFPTDFIGATFGTSQTTTFNQLTWSTSGQTIPYTSSLNVPSCQMTTAQPLLIGNSSGGRIPLAIVNSIGDGKVIMTVPNYLQDTNVFGFFLSSLMQPLNPFRIEGNIEYLINRNSTGWVLTLINNLGIKKAPSTATVVDNTQAQTIRISYMEAGKTMKSVTEMIQNVSIPIQNNFEFTVIVPAGDVQVLNIPAS